MSKGFEKVDLASCIKYLRMIDEHKLRRPDPVYRAASLVVNNQKRAKVQKQDLYAFMEQLAVAALDVNGDGSVLKVILAHHGLSPRLEPFGDYAQAEERDAVLLIGNPGIEFLRRPHGSSLRC